MKMCLEERLMEEIELCPEQRAFAQAAAALAAKIREASARLGYDLAAAATMVADGNLTIHIIPEDQSGLMFVGLPVEVGLFLTAKACGGLFPQAPASKSK
jgi:hypothetical protein